jgi:Flp pilus assembly protein TadD
MGKFEDAVPHFQKAAELEPENPAFLTNLGAALASSGNPSAAIPVFEKALKADPSNTAARDNLARARHSLEGKNP